MVPRDRPTPELEIQKEIARQICSWDERAPDPEPISREGGVDVQFNLTVANPEILRRAVGKAIDPTQNMV